MPTPDYPAFEVNINRAEALIRVFERGRRRGRPLREDTELNRSALVFAIGALDAYLHDLVLRVVADFVPNNDAVLRTLKDMQPHEMVASMARAASLDDARSHLRAKLDKHFDDKSFMDVAGLQRALKLIGCANLDADELARRTQRADIAEALGRYTDMRHRIVHRGEIVRVLKANATDCASVVTLVARAVDDEVASKYYATS